jgi:ribosomal protein L32
VGKPKKRTSARKTGLRRSHLILKLKRIVNKTSPVRIRTTKNESGKRKDATTAEKKVVKAVDKAAKAPAKAAPKKPATDK